MKLPRLLKIRQNFPDLRIPDVAAEVQRQLTQSNFASRLKPGSRVAVGVGSRGIRNIAEIVRATIAYWKAQGMRPFIFPAMGSHGAATAAGQADVLAHFDITEATMGCPVISQLEVVSLGKTEDGMEAFMDKLAYESDGVMLVGRVKWHTNFNGRLESGIFKMMAIGIGKFAGAKMYHSHAYRVGLEHVVTTVGRVVLASGKMIGGLAILEDAHHNTAKLDAIPANVLEEREVEDLALVKTWMAKLPTDIDILIVDKMGKDVSGTGMDAKVVNRGTASEYNPWPGVPKIERIFVRGITDLSNGSAVGMGMADITTDRLVSQINWEPTLVNALTAGNPTRVRLPVHFPTDRECLERITPTVGKMDTAKVTYGWIENTLELGRLAVSENLREAVEMNPLVQVESIMDFPFDAEGNLLSPFEHGSNAD